MAMSQVGMKQKADAYFGYVAADQKIVHIVALRLDQGKIEEKIM